MGNSGKFGLKEISIIVTMALVILSAGVLWGNATARISALETDRQDLKSLQKDVSEMKADIKYIKAKQEEAN
jgi:hypothetical protein